MSIQSNTKTAAHLMHLITTRNGKVPNFSLLLGSGASVTSGIPTAQDMIDQWRALLFNRSDSDDGYQEWLSEQNWFEHEDEYSILFETVYDQPAQRRVYVEECVKDAHPNWGYVYLTNLLANRFFDVIFTTNFDDLINEACYLYSDGLRPIVAAHDSAIQGVRVTSGRPKIIKLHGDFLYDNIKNTLAELETLETNTKRKLNQFAQEYGLVVLGYGGRDRSVMDTLELLLRDDDNFAQGVYWCLQRGEDVSGRLEDLLRRGRVYLVEVDGFDEFMAELHMAAQLALPKPIARPLDMARDRARLFVKLENPLRSHPVIRAHIREVLGNLSKHRARIPPSVEATMLSSRGQLSEAIPIWQRALEEAPNDETIAYRYADALAGAGKIEELAKFVPDSSLPVYDKAYFLLRAGHNQEVIEMVDKSLDESDKIKGGPNDDSAIARINRAIAHKRLGRTEEMMNDLEFLEHNGDTSSASLRAGVAALKGDREDMLTALGECLNETISPEDLEVFPVFEDYQDDPMFVDFVRTAKQEWLSRMDG